MKEKDEELMNIKKFNILKVALIIFSVLFIIPSIVYLIQNKTVMGFDTYYNFFITEDGSMKTLSTILYLLIFICSVIIYLIIIKQKDIFKNLKQLLIYIGIIGIIFIFMLPWTSSDIFYYMGVGELNSVYGQNPYYVTMEEYYEQNEDNIQDEIFEQGASSYWAGTTVVYGPIAQLIFSVLTKLSFKNINICLLLFKIINLAFHILNCYLIYKLTKKIKFVMIYGLNPFIFLEFIGNVHNDIIIVAFILLSLYFLIRKKQILPSVIFLAIGAGIKYFTLLLLPIIVLYHFRNEKSIAKRFLRCVQYGLIFLGIVLLEYAIYYEDISIFTAMMAQTNKLSKSIYSALLVFLENTFGYMVFFKNQIYYGTEVSYYIVNTLNTAVLYIFIFIYIKFCIDLLTERKIKFIEQIRKYNNILIIFMLFFTTFQQWYLIWFFATIIWQKPKNIKNILVLSAITEIANSVYMFKYESYYFDPYFISTIIILFIIWKIFNSKFFKKVKLKRRLEEV